MLVKQLKEITKEHLNQVIEAAVLLVEVKVKTTKTDKRYADVIIQDGSKSMEAKFWDYDEKEDFFSQLSTSEIVVIQALVGEYQGQLQLTIKEIKLAEKNAYQMGDFIPKSEWSLEKLEQGLKYFYDRIESPQLKQLLDEMIFSETHYEKFMTHPAARRVHHNFYHGLVQHTLEVLKFAYTVATTKQLTQRQIDRLIVMTMLHDWAKVIEYKALPDLGFTEQGTMLGHIFLGAHGTLNHMNEIEDFNEDDKLIILNGILGHHGRLEFGSPVLPKSPEAQILHQADIMSGNIESILSFMKEQEGNEESFTGKLWNMGTEYYKKSFEP
ncbi:metal dependent phosphohydrolase [Alkaliphilus metalliredigens QYMF]|uniref:Metal dependent phosphohydrolase n=1 Tax=Alkaliphilus metalliredigens (strain QYMF) TaxID=293826 RepID=A6TVP2_ALKMQ|nr:HD domain-containing protein [Alkaliphilus metalliredigens]ABR50260.1 metal dependent phosphohydrolase [Alkaliphilus metalliredigens QYMF]